MASPRTCDASHPRAPLASSELDSHQPHRTSLGGIEQRVNHPGECTSPESAVAKSLIIWKKQFSQ